MVAIRITIEETPMVITINVEEQLFIFFRNQGQDDGVVVAKALVVVELSAAIIAD